MATKDVIRFLAAATIVPAISIFLIRRWSQGGQFQHDDLKIDGKIVIITGGNSGIGSEI